MDNQHRQFNGYRELNEVEIATINELKIAAEAVGDQLEAMSTLEGVDKRALAIAKTELQTGFMWAMRAIAKSTAF